MVSKTFHFQMMTTATLTTSLTIEANSLDEARSKFVALDKRDLGWEIADPSALLIEAAVTNIAEEGASLEAHGEWHADSDGRWHVSD